MERGRGRGKKRRGGDRQGGHQQQQQQQQQPQQQPMPNPMGPMAPGGPMGVMGSPMGGFPRPMMQQGGMGMMPMMGAGMGGGMGFMGGQGPMQPHPGFQMGSMPPHMGPFSDQPPMRPPMGAAGGLPFPPAGGGGGGPPPMGLPRPPQAAPGLPRPPQEAPSNDYCQHFVNTGLRPQNYLRDSVMEGRYEDYPQLQRLVDAKLKQVRDSYTPPYGLRADLRKLKLSKDTFGCRFDVILIDPPWEEYARRAPSMVEDDEVWAWEQIMDLDISGIADTPCFVFLWCGGGAEGLEAGRHCMRRWNFRRSEDICWIKTNKEHPQRKYLSILNQDSKSVLVRTKEHCLMGIRGNVKRHLDGHIIHANMDTDVIVSEEPALGSTEKPEELYDIIERFCNGKRRIELFGRDNNMRPGWVTVGKDITHSNFKPSAYAQHFRNPDGSLYTENKMGVPRDAPTLVRSTDVIEELRPKSPGRR